MRKFQSCMGSDDFFKSNVLPPLSLALLIIKIRTSRKMETPEEVLIEY
jgi:hypothetical protein